MKQIVKLLLVLGLMLGWGLHCAGAESVTNVMPQAGEWLKKAYMSVVDAEMARAEHHNVDAEKAYREALGAYAKLKAEYPGWQTTMIDYRVAECQNALVLLEKPQVPDAEVGANKDAGTTNHVARLQGLLSELRDMKAELALIKMAGDDTPAKQMADEVTRLKEALNESTKDHQALQRKMVKLESKLRKAGGSLGNESNVLYRAVVSAVKSEANRMMKVNDLIPAIELLTEAVELMPSETDLVILLAVADCRDSRFNDAVKLMSPFDVWRAKNADALLTLGTAYMGLGEIGKARDAMDKSLAIAPNSAEAHYNLAQILITINPPDVPNAQEHYQRAVELGAPVDLDFENALRTSMIITRMKKHSATEKRSSPRKMNSEIRNSGAKTGTP